ncbi:MAG: hypothetical protein M1832_000396, partial [Thelocarpon impressellum]
AEEAAVPAAAAAESHAPDALREKAGLLAQLRAVQDERRGLVGEVVAHASRAAAAGTDRHPQYRLLIAKALGLDEGEVERCVPGILAELELEMGALRGGVQELGRA